MKQTHTHVQCKLPLHDLIRTPDHVDIYGVWFGDVAYDIRPHDGSILPLTAGAIVSAAATSLATSLHIPSLAVEPRQGSIAKQLNFPRLQEIVERWKRFIDCVGVGKVRQDRHSRHFLGVLAAASAGHRSLS